jgi:polysaccharide biosynthesis/export protein
MMKCRSLLIASIRSVLFLAMSVTVALAQEAPRVPGPVVTVDPNYRFGPEDVLSIDVWGRPDLSGTVTVDLEGRIVIPLVGEIRAGGRNSAELATTLSERFQLLDSSVSEVIVGVVQYNSLNLTILGEVRSPGYFGFRAMPDLLEALLTAGGPTSAAELALVQIVRRDPSVGEPRTILVDLSGGLASLDPINLPPLRSGDRIVVPSAEEVPIGGDRIHVLGAVNSPGFYRLTAARNVVEALTAAGGYAPEAALNKVYLTRVTSTGVTSFRLDIEHYLKRAQPLSNMELMAGDTVTVLQKSTFLERFRDFTSLLVPFISLTVTVILATN